MKRQPPPPPPRYTFSDAYQARPPIVHRQCKGCHAVRSFVVKFISKVKR